MSLLDLQREGPVARVYLNRPEVRNAFNDSLVQLLTQTFTTLSTDPQLRVVILGANGSTFCAGADLGWMHTLAGYSRAQNVADAQALADMYWAIDQCPVPVVARIQGDCYAGGVGLAAVCDVCLAVDTAQFGLTEVRLGLAPCTISPYVIRAIGERAARRYLVTGERFHAARAQALGLVHEVCALEALDEQLASLVADLLSNGPLAVRACKQLVRDVAGQALTPALRADTAARIADLRASDEGREGVQAFLHKRPPGWTYS